MLYYILVVMCCWLSGYFCLSCWWRWLVCKLRFCWLIRVCIRSCLVGFVFFCWWIGLIWQCWFVCWIWLLVLILLWFIWLVCWVCCVFCCSDWKVNGVGVCRVSRLFGIFWCGCFVSSSGGSGVVWLKRLWLFVENVLLCGAECVVIGYENGCIRQLWLQLGRGRKGLVVMLFYCCLDFVLGVVLFFGFVFVVLFFVFGQVDVVFDVVFVVVQVQWYQCVVGVFYFVDQFVDFCCI